MYIYIYIYSYIYIGIYIYTHIYLCVCVCIYTVVIRLGCLATLLQVILILFHLLTGGLSPRSQRGTFCHFQVSAV